MNKIRKYFESYRVKKEINTLDENDRKKLALLINQGILSKLTFLASAFSLVEIFYLISDLITNYYQTFGYLHLYAILSILIPSIFVLFYALGVKDRTNANNELVAFIYYVFVIGGMLTFFAADIKNGGQYNVVYYNIIILSLCPLFDLKYRIPVYILPFIGSAICIIILNETISYVSFQQPLVLCCAYLLSFAYFRLTSLRGYLQQIKLENISSEYERISKKDFLTGLSNRTALDEYKNKEVLEAINKGYSISITMADIDDFKLYNDYYSHVSGDDCLKQVANQFKMLDNDKIKSFRYGGEEFVTILINCTDDDIKLHNELVLLNVRNIKIDRAKMPSAKPYVTISMGSSTKKVSSIKEFEALLLDADNKLYISKSTGKNKITY